MRWLPYLFALLLACTDRERAPPRDGLTCWTDFEWAQYELGLAQCRFAARCGYLPDRLSTYEHYDGDEEAAIVACARSSPVVYVHTDLHWSACDVPRCVEQIYRASCDVDVFFPFDNPSNPIPSFEATPACETMWCWTPGFRDDSVPYFDECPEDMAALRDE